MQVSALKPGAIGREGELEAALKIIPFPLRESQNCSFPSPGLFRTDPQQVVSWIVKKSKPKVPGLRVFDAVSGQDCRAMTVGHFQYHQSTGWNGEGCSPKLADPRGPCSDFLSSWQALKLQLAGVCTIFQAPNPIRTVPPCTPPTLVKRRRGSSRG